MNFKFCVLGGTDAPLFAVVSGSGILLTVPHATEAQEKSGHELICFGLLQHEELSVQCTPSTDIGCVTSETGKAEICRLCDVDFLLEHTRRWTHNAHDVAQMLKSTCAARAMQRCPTSALDVRKATEW